MATHFHYFTSPKWCSGKVGVQDAEKHLLTSNMSPRQSVSITGGRQAFHNTGAPTEAAVGGVEPASEVETAC